MNFVNDTPVQSTNIPGDGHTFCRQENFMLMHAIYLDLAKAFELFME